MAEHENGDLRVKRDSALGKAKSLSSELGEARSTVASLTAELRKEADMSSRLQRSGSGLSTELESTRARLAEAEAKCEAFAEDLQELLVQR